MRLSLSASSLNGRRTRAATAVLPSGALGVWYADQYVASPRPTVPNSIAGTATSGNLFMFPRRLFNNITAWARVNATVTDAYAASQDGATGDASRILCTADGYIAKSMTIAAGTYTMAAWVKSNTGSSQPFRMRFFTASQESAKTATTSWQRFTFTATVTAGTNLLIPVSDDGASGLDVVIHDLELFSGSSDAQTTLAGHMVLGGVSGVGVPSFADNSLNFNSAYAVVQFATPGTYSQFTALAVVSKTAAGSSYQAYLSKIQSFGAFGAYMEQGSAPQTANLANYTTGGPGLWVLLNKGYNCIANRYDGTKHTTWLNDLKLYDKTGSFSAVTLQDLWVGATNDPSYLTGYKISAIAMWNRALTDAEMRTAYAVLAARAATGGNTITAPARYLIHEGDSISAFAPISQNYVYIAAAAASPAVIGANLAVGSAKLANNSGNSMVERAPVADAIIPATKAGRTFILGFLIGRNDGPNSYPVAADYATAVAAYIAARRAAGYDKIVLCTILPTSTALGAAFNPWRNLVNSIYTGPGWAAANGVDAIADFAANATMGTDTSADNATYYPDGVHPSAAGHAILEPIYRAAVNSV